VLLQAITPVIVRVVDPPTRELTPGDVLLEAVLLTGAILALALLVGLLVGALFIGFKRLRPYNPFNGDASQQFRLGLGPSPR
jgi:hypothetical protein